MDMVVSLFTSSAAGRELFTGAPCYWYTACMCRT